MAHAWAVDNLLAGLAQTAFTFTNWTPARREFLNDGAMDGVCSTGTASSSTRYLDVDLGGAKMVRGVALLNHNLSTWTGAQVSLTGAADAAFTTSVVNAKAATAVAFTPPNEKECVLMTEGTSRRYWRLTFVSSGTEALRLGELFFVGDYYPLARLKAYGWGDNEEAVVNRAPMKSGGDRTTFVGGPVRTRRLPFVDMQGTSQRDELTGLWRASMGYRPVLWVEYLEATATAATEAAQECIYGKVQPAYGWRETDFTLFDVDALELRSLVRDVGR